MNIKELKQAMALLECLEGSEGETTEKEPWVIVRGDRSGVFFGRLVSAEGQTAVVAECRHIWYWEGAANTAELALRGTSKPKQCKIVGPVNNIRITDVIEIIDCTPEAVVSLRGVDEWSEA